jgi:hypothetical protein
LVDRHRPVDDVFAVTTAPSAPRWCDPLGVPQDGASHGGLDGYVTAGEVPEWKMPGYVLVASGSNPADLGQPVLVVFG